jgi:hypothetical protein
MVELYLHSPIYDYGIVLNLLSSGTTLHIFNFRIGQVSGQSQPPLDTNAAIFFRIRIEVRKEVKYRFNLFNDTLSHL